MAEILPLSRCSWLNSINALSSCTIWRYNLIENFIVLPVVTVTVLTALPDLADISHLSKTLNGQGVALSGHLWFTGLPVRSVSGVPFFQLLKKTCPGCSPCRLSWRV